ncbi:MAG: hypothetical protein JNM76_09440 [Betaproteobacteria bacterium]|nr:hypothetical protein [Betaproteobacteria bacterium]
MNKTTMLYSLTLVALSAMHAPQARANTDFRGVLSMAPHAHLLYPVTVSASFSERILTPDLAPRTVSSLTVGWRASRAWGIEARVGRGDVTILPLRLQAGSGSAGVDAVSTLQISSAFAVMARAGLRRLSLESDPAQLIQNGSINQAKLGLGLQYQFSRSLGFRAEVERYRNLGSDRGIADTDGDAVRFDVFWRF